MTEVSLLVHYVLLAWQIDARNGQTDAFCGLGCFSFFSFFSFF